jgi:zinc resistance-associated protein
LVEEEMFRPVLAATAALAIAGSSIAYAQQRFGGPGEHGDGLQRFGHWHRLSPQDMAAFTDARIAALKAGLQLTPDQAKNWGPFEQALRDRAQLRIQRMQAREAERQQPSQAPTTPFDRLAQRADGMAKVSAALKRIAETGAPLYQSLDDAQKQRFKMLARMLRPHHHMHSRFEGNGPRWREGSNNGRLGDHGGNWRDFGGRRFDPDGRGPSMRMQNLMESDDQGSDL